MRENSHHLRTDATLRGIIHVAFLLLFIIWSFKSFIFIQTIIHVMVESNMAAMDAKAPELYE